MGYITYYKYHYLENKKLFLPEHNFPLAIIFQDHGF